MKVSVLLADYAQVADGKLNIIGAGWSLSGPMPVPFAVAILIHVPWDQTNEKHRFKLELLTQDGEPVLAPSVEGGQASVSIEADFEVGRPPGIKRGTPIDVPLAINVPPQQLNPGGRYEWRLTIDGRTNADWCAPFSIRPA